VLSLIIVPHCYLIRYNSTEQQVRTQYKTHYTKKSTPTAGFRQSSGDYGEAKSSQANHQPNHTNVFYPATLLRNQQGLSNKKAQAEMTGQVPKTKKTNNNMAALCHKTPTTSPKQNDKTKAQTPQRMGQSLEPNITSTSGESQMEDNVSTATQAIANNSKLAAKQSTSTATKKFNPWKMVT